MVPGPDRTIPVSDALIVSAFSTLPAVFAISRLNWTKINAMAPSLTTHTSTVVQINGLKCGAADKVFVDDCGTAGEVYGFLSLNVDRGP